MHHEMINCVEKIHSDNCVEKIHSDFIEIIVEIIFSHTLPKMHSNHNVVPSRTVYMTVTKCLLGMLQRFSVQTFVFVD